MGDMGQAPGRGQKSKEEADKRRETWEALATLRSQGEIHAVGVSNFDIDQISKIIQAFKYIYRIYLYIMYI